MSRPPTETSHTIAEATMVSDQSPAPRPRALLVVYHADDAGGRTRVVPLPDGAEVTFGRSRACTVHIDSERVSPNAPAINKSQNAYMLRCTSVSPFARFASARKARWDSRE